MSAPFFQPGKKLTTYHEAPHGNVKRGWRPIKLPPGNYTIAEIYRNEENWHTQELSDGYTYQIKCNDREVRISIWHNDLIEAAIR